MNFKTNGAFIGGIFPFKLPTNFKESFESLNEKFDFDYLELSEILSIRKRIFETDPDKNYIGSGKIKISVKRVVISKGRSIENIPVNIYLFNYKNSFASFVYWMDLSNETLNYSEVIELSSLVKNMKLRFRNPKIIFDYDSTTVERNSFKSVCEYFEDVIFECCNSEKQSFFNGFSHPAIYLNTIPDCENSDQIKQKYHREIAGFKNLYNQFEMEMLDVGDSSSTHRVRDFHPFNYGLSLASSNLSIEMHASNILETSKEYKMSMEEMHFDEKFDWIFQIESTVIQYYILRYFNNRLSHFPNKFPSIGSLLKNPILSFSLLHQLIKITNLYRNVYSSLDEFKRIYLVRRQYTNEANKLYEKEFAILELDNLVQNKLKALQTEINLSYTMLTTLFILIITLIGALFAFFQAWAAIVSLNLIS